MEGHHPMEVAAVEKHDRQPMLLHPERSVPQVAVHVQSMRFSHLCPCSSM